MNITEIAEKQRRYFESGATRPPAFRKEALAKLKAAVKANEGLLNRALLTDLNKPASESYMCEIGILYDEIGYHLRHLHKWMKNKPVRTPPVHFRSESFVSPEPYGVALIIAPWNYPVLLCFQPLVGAISAGCCAVMKPSAYTPAVSGAIAKIISETFPPEYIAVIEGGREQNASLLRQKFDCIFFSGSAAVGKVVMAAAAGNLTPVTLELGGKNPVIVDESADIEIAARRIAFGKILNAGQSCIAPDYLLIHKNVKTEFIGCYRTALSQFFPAGDMSDLPHIVNDRHFNRLTGLMQDEKIVIGGKSDAGKRFIEPALLDDVSFDSPVMQEEIFGPILPMIGFEDLGACIGYIRSKPRPLALYLFTKSREVEKRIFGTCSFGGGCVNDTVIHLATPYMGFGGVGESGMGSYHGKFSFDTFSHNRSIVRKHLHPDIPMRYRPYGAGKDSLIRKLLK